MGRCCREGLIINVREIFKNLELFLNYLNNVTKT